MNTILSAFSAHHVHLGHAPRVAVRAATDPREPSPIIARASKRRANLESMHALAVRFVVVAIGWALLGIYCAMVFTAFRSH